MTIFKLCRICLRISFYSVFSWMFLEPVICLNLHFSAMWTNTTPLLLYNASLGEGWSYSFVDRTRRSFLRGAEAAFSLDTNTGAIFLHRNKVCNFPLNPFELEVVSKTRTTDDSGMLLSNTTIFTFKLFFEGAICSRPINTKLHYFRRLVPFRILLYSEHSKTHSCFEKDRVVIELPKYIPQTFKQTFSGVILIKSDGDLKIDSENNIVASIEFCIKSSHTPFEIFGLLKSQNNYNLPFHVSLYLNNEASGSFSSHESYHRTRRQSQPELFSSDIYNVTVFENLPTGTFVIQINIISPDSAEAMNPEFNLFAENSASDGAFTIDRTLGTIKTSKQLDREEKDRYMVTVTVTAGPNGEYFDLAKVYISVADENDNFPTFVQDTFEVSVSEAAANGTHVLRLQAIDADIGDNGVITYAFADGGNRMGSFEISENGLIRLVDILDREYKNLYSLSVIAYDGGVVSLTSTVTVVVNVDDVNDNIPRFEYPSYNAKIVENASDGELVVQVSATDADENANSRVRYSLLDKDNDLNTFKINELSGEIRVSQGSNIDREVQSSYILKTIAYDGGMPRRSGMAEVIIKVEDINDNAPAFVSDKLSFIVPENINSSAIVAVIEAIDPDEGINAIVEYSIAGGEDADKFLLTEQNGKAAVSLNNFELDYESGQVELEILLRASSGPLFSQAMITILVDDVNDNIPILGDFEIIVNNFPGHFPSVPVGQVPAYDPDVSDQNNLRYMFITGNRAGFLRLDESTGEVTLDSRLNSDIPRNGVLQVKVTDGLHEVRANCRLTIRLVTVDMLEASVVIHLNNVTTSSFLSPLFTLFKESLATIFKTGSSDVFIIGIANETDGLKKRLEVTVAIREKMEQVGRKTEDIFFSANYLREQIDLQRTRLGALSTLQILPFQDDVCAQGPCPESHRCLALLQFDEAAPFISSDTMLFRPIYSREGYRCYCPEGALPDDPWCYPCKEHCTTENGFFCDTTTGNCSCMANHFHPAGHDRCAPCNCYEYGSLSLQCDSITGQCPCVEGVIGRQCNQCPNIHEEIRLDIADNKYSCTVVNDTCPRSFSQGIWWETYDTGITVEHDCPNGATGVAVRDCCTNKLWQEADMFNCTNMAFLELQQESLKIQSNQLQLNTSLTRKLVAELADATRNTQQMYGSDLDITLRLLNQILEYENLLSGLSLTSEQDSCFLPNLVSVLSNLMDAKYSSVFERLNRDATGTSELLLQLEAYLSTLLSVTEMTEYFATPQPFTIVTDNVALGIGVLDKTTFVGETFPGTAFEEEASIYLPSSVIRPVFTLPDMAIDSLNIVPRAYVGFMIYKSLGNLLAKSYSDDVRNVSGNSLTINSPVISVVVRDEESGVTRILQEPIVLTFKQNSSQNMANVQCVSWKSAVSGDHWSTEGCTVTDTYALDDDRFTNCSCNHLGTFALLTTGPKNASTETQCFKEAEEATSQATTGPLESTTATKLAEASTITSLAPLKSTTTQPTVPPGGCLVNKTIYQNGESIVSSPDNCYGASCQSGRLINWKDDCYQNTPPPCYGWSEKIPNQCCPVCRHQVTTERTTSPIPEGACSYKGKIFNHNDRFDTDPRGCYGYMCFNGVVQFWQQPCFVSESSCNGTLVNVTGQCCPVCQTAISTSPASDTTTMEQAYLCTIRNKTYPLDSRTNIDPCNKCYCTVNGEVCIKVTCEDDLVCDTKYRPKGECCFVCGAATALHSFGALLLMSSIIILLGLY